MRDRGQPTEGASRGQTTQDFAIGISVFLLTVAFTFAFVPSIFTPFDSDVAPGSAQQADRLADGLIADYSIDGRPNWLNGSSPHSFEADVLRRSDSDALEEELRNRYGLPEFASINVTVVEVKDSDCCGDTDDERTVIATEGAPARDRATATVSRIVVVADDSSLDGTSDADDPDSRSLDECAPPTNVGGSKLDDGSNPKRNGMVCRLIIRVW